MKKSILLLAVIFSACSTLFGQSYVWEAFDAGQMPPAGWTISGYPDQWSVSNSDNAGGTSPEAMFSYINSNGTSRLISPSFDLTGLTTVKLSFRHYYDFYANGPKIGMATRSNGGAWNVVWEITPSGNVGPEQKNFDIANSDVGSSTFQFSLYITGNLYNVDYWYLDNILLFNPLNLDGGLIALTAPTYFKDSVVVTGIMMNFGTSEISSLEIN